MDKEIATLREAFGVYYSTNYSEREDSAENFRIRKLAVEKLASALKEKDAGTAEEVLLLLAENTGCAEDLFIFEKLIEPLVATQAITQEQIEMVLNAKAIGRWR
jgi:hypothetical protein